MLKVVYNACYGGYSISDDAIALLNQKRQSNNLSRLERPHKSFGIERHDPLLVQVVEELGENADGKYAKLKIAEIPIEYQDCYEITEYDGFETVKCNPSDLTR